jgi:hypothetical protein
LDVNFFMFPFQHDKVSVGFHGKILCFKKYGVVVVRKRKENPAIQPKMTLMGNQPVNTGNYVTCAYRIFIGLS